MASHLGNKRQCPDCGVKFYDLNAPKVECPKCAFAFDAPKKRAAKSSPKTVSPKVVKNIPRPARSKNPILFAGGDDDEAMEGFADAGIAELEEFDDYDDDFEHLEEVEDHQEAPGLSIHSDDADDDMFIDEIGKNDLHIVDDPDKLDDGEREAV